MFTSLALINPPGNGEWRIEKRSLSTGTLITTFGTGGVIQENPSTIFDAPWAVAVDGTGIYLVGYDGFPGAGNDQWHIQKRSLSTGAFVGTFGSSGIVQENPSTGDDEAYAVVVDGTGVYVAGVGPISRGRRL